jgi:hypothetical protein
MWKPRIRWITAAGVVLAISIALYVIFALVGPLGMIAWNLTVRAAAAEKLAENLQQMYPTLEIRGGASYEGSRLFFNVKGQADQKLHKDIMNWLLERQRERGGHESLHLTFWGPESGEYRYEVHYAACWETFETGRWQVIP